MCIIYVFYIPAILYIRSHNFENKLLSLSLSSNNDNHVIVIEYDDVYDVVSTVILFRLLYYIVLYF